MTTLITDDYSDPDTLSIFTHKSLVTILDTDTIVKIIHTISEISSFKYE